MTVSFSVFSFLSAPALSLTMPQDLFSAALGRLTASPGTAESATKWRSSENPLVRCFQLPLSQISGSCLGFPSRNERNRNWCLHLTQILDDSLICAASLIQSTLQCFDRTLLRLSPNPVAMWPSPIVQIIWMKDVFYQCTKYLKLANLLWAVYCNFCSIIKPEPLSWTGSLGFAFLWVIHLQTSALFWCITMIDWRVHPIYHDSQQLLDAKDWETEPAVFLMCSRNASPADGSW